MIGISEQPLPGGRSFQLDTSGGRKVVAVVHDDGMRELHLYNKGGHEPSASMRLDDDDARRLGAVLSGTRFRPAIPASVAGRLGDLVVDWVRIDAGSSVAGHSLEALDLHRRTGMTVIAIVRGTQTIPSPAADTTIEVGDRVVVVGQQRQMEPLMDLLTD
ncbi:MAG: potassium transporter TrkA [Thermoleophilia bacterium]|nr:potassium transporter TrkA [Thermoleophilia bacterium]